MNSSSKTKNNKSRSQQPASHSTHHRSRLMLAVHEAESLQEALTHPQLNLAGLVACDAAAIVFNQEATSLRGDCEQLALDTLNTLHETAESGIYHSDMMQPPTSDTVALLAIRFCPPEDGWVIWFRSGQSTWADAEISAAAALRADLLEACLHRAALACRIQQRLLSTLGHDLCNPLQSITMSAALLRPQSQRDTDLSRHIMTAGKKMERLLRQIRDVNHLQSGKRISINPIRTDVSALVNAVLEDEHILYPALVIETGIEPGIQAMVDADRYAEVIAHLLGNASQQSKPGTPTTVSLQKHGHSTRLTITRQVTPLSAEQMAGLFRPNPDASHALDQSGLGMGLYICAAIVQAHNGSVSAEQVDGSIAFCLTLPRLEP